ncbi:MAG: carboxyltransferase domain-containing protein [Pseudomonadota bacterium]
MTKTPQIARVGLRGVLVTFGDSLTDEANRAAVAFRAKVEAEEWPEVQETVSTLVSTFLAVDLVSVAYDEIAMRIEALLDRWDWGMATSDAGRKLWTIPMCFDPDVAPQIEDAAQAAGLTMKAAQAEFAAVRTRVITLGFAPGQPYLGLLPDTWDIPRQSNLTPKVPVGALVIAIRQFVLFATSAPTGWRHVGQTAFRPFDPTRDAPIAFSPGDMVRFAPITVAELTALEGQDSLGGAEWTVLQ